MEEIKRYVPDFGPHVVQYSKEYSLCTGCSTCEIVCSLMHEGVVSPNYRRIKVKRGTTSMIHQVLSCQHCLEHPCYDACPLQDEAMRLDEQRNIAYIDNESCIGCGKCATACKFTPSRITLVKSKDKAKRKARKCDLCHMRPEGPACIEWCSVRCLGLSSDSVLVPKAVLNKESEK
jgi:Fe-S-cluster-containing hydrogenase component 2